MACCMFSKEYSSYWVENLSEARRKQAVQSGMGLDSRQVRDDGRWDLSVQAWEGVGVWGCLKGTEGILRSWTECLENWFPRWTEEEQVPREGGRRRERNG